MRSKDASHCCKSMIGRAATSLGPAMLRFARWLIIDEKRWNKKGFRYGTIGISRIRLTHFRDSGSLSDSLTQVLAETQKKISSPPVVDIVMLMFRFVLPMVIFDVPKAHEKQLAPAESASSMTQGNGLSRTGIVFSVVTITSASNRNISMLMVTGLTTRR